MNIKKWKIKIKNITPTIYNRVKKELMDEVKELKKDEIIEWENKNWWRKAEYDNKGNLVLPSEWIKGAFIQACKSSRLVPHYATSKKETYTRYAEAMTFETPFPIGRKNMQKAIEQNETDEDVLVSFGQFLGGQGKNSSTKVWRVRPLLKKWSTTFYITDVFGRMKKEELKTLLEYAGMLCGVGDNRKNNYGRIEAEEISEVKNG